MSYKILIHNDPEKLAEMVQGYLDDGYSLIGGVAIANSPLPIPLANGAVGMEWTSTTSYAQAVRKAWP